MKRSFNRRIHRTQRNIQVPNTLYWHKRRSITPMKKKKYAIGGKLMTQKQHDFLLTLGVSEQEMLLMNRFMASQRITSLLR